jgi:hypothetical protein
MIQNTRGKSLKYFLAFCNHAVLHIHLYVDTPYQKEMQNTTKLLKVINGHFSEYMIITNGVYTKLLSMFYF